MDFDQLLPDAVEAALLAGAEISNIYSRSFKTELKADQSPLTEADIAAHGIISRQLSTSGFPLLSEEGSDIPFDTRKTWKTFWLIDPLDGTKEFISRNGEFTVNIALISDGLPVMGVVYAPVAGTLYFASEKGSFRKEPVFTSNGALALSDAIRLPAKKDRRYTVVASRSHMNEQTLHYIDSLKKQHPELDMVSRGSSLKLCLVAEGSADVYPRFGPTMEWDTAAGHAILRFAGCEMTDAHNGGELIYNKEDLHNPHFIASAK
jgi:3'(2'), 5'-bisphosphate nucleotidase